MGVHHLRKSEENEEARRLLFNPEEPRIFFVRGRSLKKFENPARCEENLRENAENRGAQVSFALNSEEE